MSHDVKKLWDEYVDILKEAVDKKKAEAAKSSTSSSYSPSSKPTGSGYPGSPLYGKQQPISHISLMVQGKWYQVTYSNSENRCSGDIVQDKKEHHYFYCREVDGKITLDGSEQLANTWLPPNIHSMLLNGCRNNCAKYRKTNTPSWMGMMKSKRRKSRRSR